MFKTLVLSASLPWYRVSILFKIPQWFLEFEYQSVSLAAWRFANIRCASLCHVDAPGKRISLCFKSSTEVAYLRWQEQPDSFRTVIAAGREQPRAFIDIPLCSCDVSLPSARCDNRDKPCPRPLCCLQSAKTYCLLCAAGS